jgi:hypothetical protein
LRTTLAPKNRTKVQLETGLSSLDTDRMVEAAPGVAVPGPGNARRLADVAIRPACTYDEGL